MEKRLKEIEEKLGSANPLTRLQLVQERMNLQSAMGSTAEAVDVTSLEEDFVAAAKEYGERKGISYAAWREAGVDAAVLKRAGITRAGA